MRPATAQLLAAQPGSPSIGGNQRGWLLLHPGVLFLLLWSVALGGWALLSPAWFLRVVHAEKVTSLNSLAFFVIAVGAFVVGTLVGPAVLRVDGREALVPAREIGGADQDTIVRKLGFMAAFGVACALFLLVAGTMRFGGPGALWSYVASGGSWEPLALNYFRPVRLPGITVWFHLLVAVGPLATVMIMVTDDRARRRRLQALFVVAFVLIVAVSFTQAERLVAFGYIVASVVAWLGVKLHFGDTGSHGRTIAKVAAGVGVLVLLWSASEFSRTVLATRTPGAPVTITAVGSDVTDRFLAYILGSVNNGMYAIDHQKSVGYVGYLGSAVVTATNLDGPDSPILGPVLADEGSMITQIYPYGHPLTTFSMPEMVFADVRWIAPIVIFWFGLLAGCVFVRFRAGELWALLVYPGIVVGILDSTRILYWTRTEMIVPLVAFTVICLPLYRARRPSSVAGLRSVPHVSR